MSREPCRAPWRVAEWDGRTLGGWIEELQGARAVIRFAMGCHGSPVAGPEPHAPLRALHDRGRTLEAGWFSLQAPLSSTACLDEPLGVLGKRWNLAFTEMVQLSLYRPLAARIGTTAAAFAGFLFSGLLHEIAITLPARGGYGRPLLYFALQGGLVLTEKALGRSDHAIDRHRWIGRIWTLAALALPLPILLVPEFLQAAIWPIIGMN